MFKTISIRLKKFMINDKKSQINKSLNSVTATLDKKTKNYPLHLKALQTLILEINNILATTLVINDLIITQIAILTEGLALYINQFGFNKTLLQQIVLIQNSYLAPINPFLITRNFRKTYRTELEKTLLFFAFKDELFTRYILDTLHINFTTSKPWLVPSLRKLNISYNVHHITSTPLWQIPCADESGCLIPAIFPQGGFILSKLDQYTEEFVKHAVACNESSLNIGSGYGIIERLSLLLGARKIICNDISQEHLDTIKNLTPKHYHSKLKFLPGSFPEEITLPDNSIQLIGIFRVLHFLAPDMLIKTIKKIYDLLMPNGVLILSAETPYLRNWQKFIPEYEKRLKIKELWPGYVTNPKAYETAGYHNQLPSQMNFLDMPTLTRILTENNFTIENCTTFSRAGTFPSNTLLDGRESVGAIARKII